MTKPSRLRRAVFRNGHIAPAIGALAIAAAAPLAHPATASGDGSSDAPAQPVERRFEGPNGALATLRVTPGEIAPDTEAELEIRVETPPGGAFELPADLADRFEGLVPEGDYTDEAGVRHVMLAPEPGVSRHRVRPLAVELRLADGTSASFVAGPMEVPGAPLDGAAPGELTGAPGFSRIGPGAKAIARALGAAAAGAAALALVAAGAAKIRRLRRARRLSPRERALRELDDLLARNLPGRDRMKEFYLKLTLVVRRYMERRHGLRAPRQTTEEFLAAAARHPSFSPETIRRLDAFLEAADLVKFAGVQATAEEAAAAAAKAREYLENDPVADARKRDRP